MPLKNHVRELVEKKKISVYRFKVETGIANRTAYDLYNKPYHLPSPEVLSKICDTYQIQPSEVLEWVSPEK